jgi:hypothetical protein
MFRSLLTLSLSLLATFFFGQNAKASSTAKIHPSFAIEMLVPLAQQQTSMKNLVKAIGFPKAYESQLLNYFSSQKLSEEAVPYLSVYGDLLLTDGLGTHKISFDPQGNLLIINSKKIRLNGEASEESFAKIVAAIEKAMTENQNRQNSFYGLIMNEAQAQNKDDLLYFAKLRTNGLKVASFVGVVAVAGVGAVINPAIAIAALSAGAAAAAECDKKGDYCPVTNQDLIKTALGKENELQSFKCKAGIPTFKINDKIYEFDPGGPDFKSMRSISIKDKDESTCHYDLYWSMTRLEPMIKQVLPVSCKAVPPETSVEKALAGIPVRRMFECCVSKSDCQSSIKEFAKATPFKSKSPSGVSTKGGAR